MLTITISGVEIFDEASEQFYELPGATLLLEHSLVSLSKWESKWHKPFLGVEKKTTEETLDYIRCMLLNDESSLPQNILSRVSNEDIDRISEYINESMTATWFTDKPTSSRGRQEIVTAELIYYWMVSLTIPFTCEEWHLNRLLTLIKVCSQKNAPQKKMSKSEIAARNRSLNAQRKAQMGTRG